MEELDIVTCEELCGKGRKGQGGKVTNADDIAEDFEFGMYDEDFSGTSDECAKFGLE